MKSNKPALIAYAVKEPVGAEQKAIWTRIGWWNPPRAKARPPMSPRELRNRGELPYWNRHKLTSAP